VFEVSNWLVTVKDPFGTPVSDIASELVIASLWRLSPDSLIG
jgi:hypothetical protein